jgi:bacteriocin resistance YdeI/OmpD-like protein/uncharacterized protein DUF1905
MRQEFETILQSGERGRVYIVIPFVPGSVWAKRSRYYVAGTLNGVAYEGSLGVRDGEYFMPVNKQIQEAAGIKPGDKIRVVMELAKAKNDELPDSLKAALDSHHDAARFFESLTAFQRNTYITWIASAKTDDTRDRRVHEAIESLQSGKKQR